MIGPILKALLPSLIVKIAPNLDKAGVDRVTARTVCAIERGVTEYSKSPRKLQKGISIFKTSAHFFDELVPIVTSRADSNGENGTSDPLESETNVENYHRY
jgi:hypothetical protein